MEISETQPRFNADSKVKWYRCQIDKTVLAELMKTSDWHGYRQALGHFGLWLATGSVAYLAFHNIAAANWYWSAPLLLVALFAHGTVGAFIGGAPCHELSHKTPFKTKPINELFHKAFCFFGWFDRIGYRSSHVRHHQLTVYHDHDGEVELPQLVSFKDWHFWLANLAWDPRTTWQILTTFMKRARGQLDNEWYEFLFPETNEILRRKHRNWARFCLAGHAVLAAVFILSGHWFLVVLVTFGSHYCRWLTFLTGFPQHVGLKPDVPDHRLCCRTFTCSWLPGFLYWNMQYHADHHMFPAVPFYNLPKLHKAIEHDMPPAPHGLLATWKEIVPIMRRQQMEPDYYYVPPLPGGAPQGTHASHQELQQEATLVPG